MSSDILLRVCAPRLGGAAFVALAAFAALGSVPPPLAAQVQASEMARTVQIVDGTTITIEHYRPVARGRAPLFGNLVDWDELWTPGANWSTTLEVDRPVTLNGEPLDAGRYSVWMIPREAGPWTVILDARWRRYHTDYPRNDAQEALRFETEPETGHHMEALSWYVPVFTRAGAVVRMHWGETWVDLDLTVTPSADYASFPSELADRYTGTYAVSGDGGSATLAVRTAGDGVAVTVSSASGALSALPGRFMLWPSTTRPGSAHAYNPALMADGQLRRVLPEWTLVFDAGETGPASSLEVRRPGEVVAAGG